jgi:carboxyl-terminal processing protease
VGYVRIGAWTPSCADAAGRALDALKGQRALIVDVRPNSGGDDALALRLAGRFVERPTRYGWAEDRAARGFSPRRPQMLQPDGKRAHFRGRVAVLMGPRNMGGAESFLLMMRAAGATLVGARSYGASSEPQPHRLSNGVVVDLPSFRQYRDDGTLLEGNGVEPDVRVEWPTAPTDDPVLGAALDRLR